MVDRLASEERARASFAAGGPLTTGELAVLSGVSLRQLRYWCAQGYVPTVSPGQGFDWAWPVEAVAFFLEVGRRLAGGMAVGPRLFEPGPVVFRCLPSSAAEVAPRCAPQFRHSAEVREGLR